MSVQTVYQTDFYAWTRSQADLLRAGRLSEIDIVHLAEELDSMGNSERRQLASRMEILIAHLLKWRFQPSLQGNSWRLTIKEQRRRIAKLLKQMPSLSAEMDKDDWLADVWEDAVFYAVKETGFDESIFPADPIWTAEQILDSDWLPESN